MEELMAKLQGILSTPEGMQQLQNIQQMFANGSPQTQASQNAQTAQTASNPFMQNQTSPPMANAGGFTSSGQSGGGLDMSALSSMLGGLMNNGGANGAASSGQGGNGGGLDMSALSSMLGGLMNNGGANGAASSGQGGSGGGLDMSALSSMLGGLMNNGGANGSASSGQDGSGGGLDMSALSSMLGGIMGNGGGTNGSGGGIDMGSILRLQQIFSALNRNDKNTQLLYALKPHFSVERQAKVDQAVSIMRLLAMLPAIKESGLFSGL